MMKALTLIGFLFVFGCAQIAVGMDFDRTKLDRIVKGKTSKGEVVKILGEPTDKDTEAGLERWIYVHRVTSASPKPEWLGLSYRGDTKEKRLAIIFERDVVRDFLVSETTRPFVSSVGF